MSSFLIGVALDATDEISGPSILRAQRDAALTLDEAGIDFVTLSDTLSGTGSVEFDALSTLAAIGAQTRQIGLVPTVTTTHTEPFHIASATGTIDFTARNRAGWEAAPTTTEAAASAVGRRPTPLPHAAWSETADVIDTVRALWDSWESDAEIRDSRTNRFLDRSKVHYVDRTLTDSEGTRYSVKGPSIVPRSPQGNPPVFVTATDADSLRVASSHSDVILLAIDSVDEYADAIDGVDRAVADAGRNPGDVTVVPSVPFPSLDNEGWLRAQGETLIAAGAAGIHLRPAELSAGALAIATDVSGSAGKLGEQRSGLSLRDRLGLPVTVNQFAS